MVEERPTPNPNAVKFVLPRSFFTESISCRKGGAVSHPLVRALLSIASVESVLLLKDFVTVNKAADASWPTVKRAVRKVLNEWISTQPTDSPN